ncbi:family 10 glycosylhydrolase [bacterium]|nr:family 10 glycosylhydrolase [bacterium]
MRCLTTCAALLLVTAAFAQNLAPNPGAEGADGKFPGFARYTGAGVATVASSVAEKHSGQGCACLDVTGWYHRPTESDTPANHTVNVALVLADNDGFTGKGALPGQAGELYAVSFWYKGDLPAATVRGMAWPGPESQSADRVQIPGLAETIVPGPQWRPFGATFRLPANAPYFAIQINATGLEKDGYRLGKVFVDDVRISVKSWPDGEMRAVWWWGPKERADRERCLAESTAMLDRLKATGFNTILLSVNSLVLAAVDRPELRDRAPGADWDWYGEVVKLATARGLQVHAWYAPWTYKRAYSSVEQIDHPDWKAVYAGGRAAEDAICFVRPESRQYQLDLLRRALERYPDLAGLHIEEPGHPTCHCGYCAKLAQEWLGLDIVADPAGTEASLRNLAAFMNGDFFARLRGMVNAMRPEVWLSANGSAGANPDWSIARDWPTWSRRGYIDFYIPQIYTEDVARFGRLLGDTQGVLGGGTMVAGMAVSWTGIYPRRQDPQNIVAEIKAARQAGAKGFCVFRAALFEAPHWQALGEVIREK